MTPRRAAVLATQLPAGAQTWVACGYDNAWTLTDHLTATLVDVLQIANWQRAGDSKAKRPTPVKRPHDIRGDDAKAERMDAKARAFLERQKRHEEGQKVHPNLAYAGEVVDHTSDAPRPRPRNRLQRDDDLAEEA